MKDWKTWMLMLLLMSLITPMTFGQPSGELKLKNPMMLDHILMENWAIMYLDVLMYLTHGNIEEIILSAKGWKILNEKAEERASEAVKVAVIPLKAEIAAKNVELGNHTRDMIIGITVAAVAGGVATAIIIAVIQ